MGLHARTTLLAALTWLAPLGMTTIRTLRTVRATALLEWGFGPVLWSDRAIAIGIQPGKEGILTVWWEFFEELAGFELIEAHATALIQIQFPESHHRRPPIASLGAATAGQFIAAKAAIGILVQALEKAGLLL